MSSNEKKFREGYYNDDYPNEVIDSDKQNFNQKVKYISFDEQNDDEYIENNYDEDDNEQYYDEDDQESYTPKKSKLKKIILWVIGVLLGSILLIFLVGLINSYFVPDKTNILIMATDKEGTRTDTLMVASFDKNSKLISLISIPRDTYVKVDDDVLNKMKKDYPQPQSSSMKINAVHHYGGKKYGVSMVKAEVERLMNIDIDYYVKVDFEAFRYIIDSVGGVEFYVPQNMEYSDPYQDLYINLKEGNQVLNGEQAEHLLRYRSGYADADLGRVRVQQDFIKAFISQTFSKGSILSNPLVYLKALFKYDYVETDIGLFDVASYALLIGGINAENIESYTLPGFSNMQNGQSVYQPNVAEIEKLVSEIMGD